MNDELLRTLKAEVKLIVNPRQLTVETISDLKSEMLFSPSNSLIIKTDFVMRPSCEFSKQDIAMIMYLTYILISGRFFVFCTKSRILTNVLTMLL